MLFTFFPLFLNNKTQTLRSPHIVCVGLVLYLALFGNKFAFICGGVVLMLNLIIIIIIIIIIIKKKTIQPDSHELGWIMLNSCDGLGWVGFF